MVEFYGWLNLRFYSDKVDVENELNADADYQKINPQMELILPKLVQQFRIVQSAYLNGNYVLTIAGVRNHFSGIEDVVSFFETKVFEIAPESYGVLYIYDDESEKHPNEFQVMKIAQGKTDFSTDSFFELNMFS